MSRPSALRQASGPRVSDVEPSAGQGVPGTSGGVGRMQRGCHHGCRQPEARFHCLSRFPVRSTISLATGVSVEEGGELDDQACLPVDRVLCGDGRAACRRPRRRTAAGRRPRSHRVSGSARSVLRVLPQPGAGRGDRRAPDGAHRSVAGGRADARHTGPGDRRCGRRALGAGGQKAAGWLDAPGWTTPPGRRHARRLPDLARDPARRRVGGPA